jgi:hypothetical protein
MTRPLSSSKVVLIEDPRCRAREEDAVPVRRYRLARLRFDSRPTGPDARFEHLGRVFD